MIENSCLIPMMAIPLGSRGFRLGGYVGDQFAEAGRKISGIVSLISENQRCTRFRMTSNATRDKVLL